MLLVIVSLTTLSQRWNNKQSPVTYLFNKIIFWQNISIKKQKERTKRHITKMFTGFNRYWPYWWTWPKNKSILLFVVAWKCIVVPHMNIYIYIYWRKSYSKEQIENSVPASGVSWFFSFFMTKQIMEPKRSIPEPTDIISTIMNSFLFSLRRPAIDS